MGFQMSVDPVSGHRTPYTLHPVPSTRAGIDRDEDEDEYRRRPSLSAWSVCIGAVLILKSSPPKMVGGQLEAHSIFKLRRGHGMRLEVSGRTFIFRDLLLCIPSPRPLLSLSLSLLTILDKSTSLHKVALRFPAPYRSSLVLEPYCQKQARACRRASDITHSKASHTHTYTHIYTHNTHTYTHTSCPQILRDQPLARAVFTLTAVESLLPACPMAIPARNSNLPESKTGMHVWKILCTTRRRPPPTSCVRSGSGSGRGSKWPAIQPRPPSSMLPIENMKHLEGRWRPRRTGEEEAVMPVTIERCL